MKHGRTRAKNNVRQYRKALWFTQRYLAGRAGVSMRTIISLEKGFGCRDITKRKILRALSVPFKDRELVFPNAEEKK